MSKLIGINGYAGSGKDAVADVLVDLNYEVKSWADPMREIAIAINPILHVTEHGRIIRYNDALRDLGYRRMKDTYEESRNFLQKLGTEGGRHILGHNIWVDTLMQRLDTTQNYVIPDTRFVNEAQAIWSKGGLLVRVNRPGVGPANDHVSETGLDDWNFDIVIENDGTLDDLRTVVLDLLA